MQLNKKELIHKGQLLNIEEVEFSAMQKFGVRKYRKELSEQLNISQARISHAFSGDAPYLLYRINQLVKVNITRKEGVVNSSE